VRECDIRALGVLAGSETRDSFAIAASWADVCECLTFGARSLDGTVDSSAELRLEDDGASEIRLIDDVRLTPAAEDMAE
jgi:hypothetical protein